MEMKQNFNGDLIGEWKTFTTTMGDHLVKNVQNQQAGYRQAYGEWMDLNTQFGKHITKALIVNSKESQHLVDEIKTVQEEMRQTLEELGKGVEMDIKPMLKKWSDVSERMDREIMALTDDSDRFLEEYNALHRDFSEKISNESAAILSGKKMEMSGLLSLVNEYASSTTNMFSRNMRTNGERVKGVVRPFIESGKGLDPDIEKVRTDLDQLYRNAMAQWNERLDRSMQTMNHNSQRFFNMYNDALQAGVDYSTRYWNLFQPHGNTDISDIEDKMVDLQGRIDQMDSAQEVKRLSNSLGALEKTVKKNEGVKAVEKQTKELEKKLSALEKAMDKKIETMSKKVDKVSHKK